RRRSRERRPGARLARDAAVRPAAARRPDARPRRHPARRPAAAARARARGRAGPQLAAELRLRSPAPAVVFVTAHPEHALQAFDLDAVDYLTKPVKRERLQAPRRRVAQLLGSPIKPGGAVKMDDDVPVIVVSDRGRIIRVPVADVL